MPNAGSTGHLTEGLLDMHGLSRLCPDMPARHKLLALALEHLRADRRRAWQALAEHDHRQALASLHRIKGAASMLCLSGHPLIEQFDTATAALNAGDSARLEQALAALERGIERLESNLAAALENAAPTD